MTTPVQPPTPANLEKIDLALNTIFAARERNNMEPTIAACKQVVRENPGHARALYELGGAYDTAGREEEARHYYELARRAGLAEPYLERWFLQYGSTLRNIGDSDRSLEIFDEAIRLYPSNQALRAFRAITLFDAGKNAQAVGALLGVIAETGQDANLDRYRAALRGNADYLSAL